MPSTDAAAGSLAGRVGVEIRPLVRGVLLFALCYGLTARLGLNYSTLTSNVTLLWPPTGLSLYVFLRYGYRYWPGIVLGDLIANWGTGASLAAVMGIAAGNVLQTLLCAWLLQRFAGFRGQLERVRDVLYLLSLGTACAAVSATLGPASLALDGRFAWSLYGSVWLQWLMGDATGVVVLTPLLLAWTVPIGPMLRVRRIGEALALLVLLLAANEARQRRTQESRLAGLGPLLNSPRLIRGSRLRPLRGPQPNCGICVICGQPGQARQSTRLVTPHRDRQFQAHNVRRP